MSGPLTGLRVVELGGIGPVPHAGMVLADLGADLVRIERPTPAVIPSVPGWSADVVMRGRRIITADLREDSDRIAVLSLISEADVVIEGFRPGVAERLGVGPEACRTLNPGVVYGRMTGFGQSGQLASRPGHDINYLAISGVLNTIGRHGAPPTPPLNFVADYGGGSMLLLVGVLSALWEREHTGLGQVVDAAMVDGTSVLAQMVWTFRAAGTWNAERGTNLTDSGAPFYDSYETADGRYMAVGAMEPVFYATLLERLGLSEADLPGQYDRAGWPTLRRAFSQVFRTRTFQEWTATFEDVDACVTPVLTLDEAAEHPHLRDRRTIVDVDGVRQAAPAPRFSRTSTSLPPGPARLTSVTEVLASWTEGLS